jgi:alanine racemase
MIDVTEVKDISVGDEVIVFGHKNGLTIPVEDIAKTMNTINYEVLCIIGKRVPRVYIQNGKVVEILNYLV